MERQLGSKVTSCLDGSLRVLGTAMKIACCNHGLGSIGVQSADLMFI